MFCATCNLHFPEHLNFCRRCGQPLVNSAAESVVESHCCTRCGARVVQGENFCQQCGYSLILKAPETVIGACYHCGTSWRSGWLFCKTCGLDRDQAMQSPVSAPAPPGPGQTKVVTVTGELSKVERAMCPKCGSEAKPYSRYCESCGYTLDKANTGKLKTPPAAASLLTQSPETISENASDQRILSPVQVQTPAVTGKEYETVTNESENGDEVKEPTAPLNDSQTRVQRGKTIAFRASRPTTNLDENQSGDLSTIARSGPLPSTQATRVSGPLIDPVVLPDDDFQQQSKRADYQTIAIIMGFLVLTIAVALWWILRPRTDTAATTENQAKALPTAEATTQPLPTTQISPTIASTIPDGMVYVPGGNFKMGRSEGDKFELPQFDESVKPFYIDRTEVTNEEYLKFVKATQHRAPLHWKDGILPAGSAKLPVVFVSWGDADRYAKWAGKRLPTEAEWEFAARGTDGRIFPWGNNWDPKNSNAGRGPRGSIAEVGSFKSGASPFGAFDMSGNVWEWTSGNLFNYARRDILIAGVRVIRGGAYDVPQDRATASYRGAVPPDKTYEKTGFRCVRDVR